MTSYEDRRSRSESAVATAVLFVAMVVLGALTALYEWVAALFPPMH